MRRLLVSLTIAAGLLYSGSAVAQTVLRVSNWLPPSHLIVTDIVQVWADQVEEKTEGRVKVEIIPALGAPNAHFDIVREGVADVSFMGEAYVADRLKLAAGARLPFMSDSTLTTSVAYWRIYEKYFKEHDEYDGVKVVSLWTVGPGYIHLVKEDIGSVDDLKGLKVRVSGGESQTVAERLEMVPVFAPASQVYEQLSSGVSDGAIFNMDSVPAFKLDAFLKSSLMVPGGFYRDTMFFIINPAKFDSLSAEDQAAIESVSGETLAWIAGKAWDKGDGNAQKMMEEKGHNFVVPEGEFLENIKAALAPMEEEWIESVKSMGVDGAQVLADYRAEIANVEEEMKKMGE